MRHVLTAAAVAAMALAAASSAPADKTSPTRSVRPGARPLAGYALARSEVLPARAGTQARGHASCPAGTVVLSGGTLVGSESVLAGVNSSFPDGDGWTVDVNNGSAFDTLFSVYAICASLPRRYQVVEAGRPDNPTGSQTAADARCPRGSQPVGGGVLSSSGSVAVNLNTSIPEGRTWHVDLNNASGFDASFEPFAVCAKLPRYQVVVGAAVANPAGAQSNGVASCPRDDLVVGGGVASSASLTSVSVNSTLPTEDGWQSWVNNGSSDGWLLVPYAICAA